jgi:hypothetical protein
MNSIREQLIRTSKLFLVQQVIWVWNFAIVMENKVSTFLYAMMKKDQIVIEVEDCQFPGQDFGLPRTVDEVKAELMDAERELDTPSAWTPLSEFISDFKQSHQSWLQ